MPSAVDDYGVIGSANTRGKPRVVSESRRAAERLGARLRLARQQSRFPTQREVAAQLGEARGPMRSSRQAFVAKCETGQRRVTAAELQWFAQLYERPVAWFYAWPTGATLDDPTGDGSTDGLMPSALADAPVFRTPPLIAAPRGRDPETPPRPRWRRPSAMDPLSWEAGADREALEAQRADRRRWLSARIAETAASDTPAAHAHLDLRATDRWLLDAPNDLGETPLYEALRCFAWPAVRALLELGADIFGYQPFTSAPRAIARRGSATVPETPWALAVEIVRYHPARAATVEGAGIALRHGEPLALLELLLTSDTAYGCDFRLTAVRQAIQAQRDAVRRARRAPAALTGANFQVAAHLDDELSRTAREKLFYRALRVRHRRGVLPPAQGTV